MHVPYCLLVSPYQLTDYEHRNSSSEGISYTYFPYFNYSYYAVPVYYAETDYQHYGNISRKEKGIPLKKFLKPKSTPTDMPTPEGTSTGMPTPGGTSTGMPTPKGISIPYVPFSNTLSPISSSKDGPYGDITNMVESTDKFK